MSEEMKDQSNTQIQEPQSVTTSENPTIENTITESTPTTSGVDFQSILNELPDDLKSDPSLNNIKNTTTLIKNYINAQKMIGNSVRIPRKDDPQEIKDAFYNKLKDIPGIVKLPTPGNKNELDALYSALGRPMTADGYKISAPEGAQVSEDISNAFKGLAHNIGLNPQQAQVLANFQFGLAQAEYEKNVAEVNETKAILAKEWGHEYDNRINGIKELIKTYSTKFPNHAEALSNDRVMNNPVVLLMAAELAKSYKERGMIDTGNQLKYGLTPDEAREKIKAIHTDPALKELKEAYLNDRHPGHRAAVEKMQQYYNASHS